MRTFPEIPSPWLWWCVVSVLSLGTSMARAQSGASWSTNHYAVVGETVKEIQRSIDRARPWKREHSHAAFTDWSIRTRFAVVAFEGGYRCSGFTTQTSIRITMPQWRESEAATEEVQSEWKRFHEALLQHEAGHGQIALAAAAEMHRQVAAIGVEPDQTALKQRVEQLVEQVTSEYRRRETEYDRLTEHGATQGVRLRVRPAVPESRRSPGGGKASGEEERPTPD
jgi:predicted secreted Zn-dependent protease